MSFFDTMKDMGYVEENGSDNTYTFYKSRYLADIYVIFDVKGKTLRTFLTPNNLIHSELDIQQLSKNFEELQKDTEKFVQLSKYKRT